MSIASALATFLVFLTCLVASPPEPIARLARLDLPRWRSAGELARAADSAPWRAAGSPAALRVLAATGAGLAPLVLIGGVVGLAGGVVASVVTLRALALVEPASSRRLRERVAKDLPLAADLLAGGVRSGATIDDVTVALGEALGPPLGPALLSVLAVIRLGAEPAVAWESLPERVRVLGVVGSLDDTGLPGFSRALGRTMRSGAPLAPALIRIATEVRDSRRAAALSAAHRVGVQAVGPLAVCFLPAFVLVGVVPLVVSVAGSVLGSLV